MQEKGLHKEFRGGGGPKFSMLNFFACFFLHLSFGVNLHLLSEGGVFCGCLGSRGERPLKWPGITVATAKYTEVATEYFSYIRRSAILAKIETEQFLATIAFVTIFESLQYKLPEEFLRHVAAKMLCPFRFARPLLQGAQAKELLCKVSFALLPN